MRHGKITYNPQRDYYSVLGVADNVSPDDLRQAYRHAVRAAHPDLYPDRAEWATEQLQLINEAYNVLRDPVTRQDYNRLRWMHVPAQPYRRPEGYRSPYEAPSYDFNRPWWEQAVNYTSSTTRASVFETDPATPPARASAFKTLNTFLGLWNTPYSGLLMMLSIALAINIAVILYALTDPSDSERKTAAAPVQPTPTSSTTLYQSCEESGVDIDLPHNYALFDRSSPTIDIVGTIQIPDLRSYRVDLAYWGYNVAVIPADLRWEPIHVPSGQQTVPSGPMTQPQSIARISMPDRISGFYIIRIQGIPVTTQDLPPCDIIVQFDAVN